ncbi:MAG: ornithine carbamoyltransferase [Bacteroidetes bacterium]|nr:ornithine carbamoyltransferase [Bacteroidota bacterium]
MRTSTHEPHSRNHKAERYPLFGKDLLSIDDLTTEDIERLLHLTAEIKNHPLKYRKALDGKIMALIFEKPSLRTRTTFDVGIKQLGGDSVYLSPLEINLGKRESIHDVAKNLERMVDGIMIRTFGHDVCTSFAQHCSKPVINGLTDFEHPCQALADFFTIQEIKKDIKSLKLSYIGDGNNVAHSLMLTAAKLGAHLVVATPDHYQPAPEVVQRAQEIAKTTGASIMVETDPADAADNADMIYTDTWTSMGQEQETELRRAVFMPYQINKELFSRAKRDAMFMHCLPAHRGEEVIDEVIDSENSVVFQEAENRLHIEKAIMLELLGD